MNVSVCFLWYVYTRQVLVIGCTLGGTQTDRLKTKIGGDKDITIEEHRLLFGGRGEVDFFFFLISSQVQVQFDVFLEKLRLYMYNLR